MKRKQPPVPRKTPRQARATVTVDAMLAAVEIVLHRHGAAGLTTNRVAEVAGVSVGSLYHYFPNKEAMVGALQERVLQDLLSVFRAALAAAQESPLAEVAERIALGMVGVHRSQRPIHRWLIELRTSAAYHARFIEVLDTFTRELAEFLTRRSHTSGEDTHALAFTLVHAIEGIANAVGSRPGTVDVEAVMRATVRMVVSVAGDRPDSH